MLCALLSPQRIGFLKARLGTLTRLAPAAIVRSAFGKSSREPSPTPGRLLIQHQRAKEERSNEFVISCPHLKYSRFNLNHQPTTFLPNQMLTPNYRAITWLESLTTFLERYRRRAMHDDQDDNRIYLMVEPALTCCATGGTTVTDFIMESACKGSQGVFSSVYRNRIPLWNVFSFYITGVLFRCLENRNGTRHCYFSPSIPSRDDIPPNTFFFWFYPRTPLLAVANSLPFISYSIVPHESTPALPCSALPEPPHPIQPTSTSTITAQVRTNKSSKNVRQCPKMLVG